MRDYQAEGVDLDAFFRSVGIATEGTFVEIFKAHCLFLAAESTEDRPRLNEDQQKAFLAIQQWIASEKPYFVLRGFAGVGKSFMMGTLAKSGIENLYFSATTNKAAKVLGKSIGRVAKTTYSLLGLKMVEAEDSLVLTPSETPPHFPRGSVVVVDECSMVGEPLIKAIDEARQRTGIRIIYVGDPAQLPPVGEARSPAWRCTDDPKCNFLLKKVMRNDNELLDLATRIRRCIKDRNWESPIENDVADDGGGVWVWRSYEKFERNLLKQIETADLRETKVICWRNRTVDMYTRLIRERLGFNDAFNIGDSLLLAEPIEEQGHLVAHTDEEFSVYEVHDDAVNIDGTEIEVWKLHVSGDQDLQLKIPKQASDLQEILSAKASLARTADRRWRREKWRDFWNTKKKFNTVRYGYALTAHRSQGSSYNTVFVDQQDMLVNPNKREAFRAFYVACTRPTYAIHTF